MDHLYTAIREEDYAQSANTLFHFMKKEEYLKDILVNKAIVPRYCMENMEYLGISSEGMRYDEIAVLQKCFCDIPFHKLTASFALHGTGETFESLTEDDQYRASMNNTHPDFYGAYGVAFSKGWGEEHHLQPVHYLNERSDHTKDFAAHFGKVLEEEDISDAYVDDILNRLSFIKPLRGVMNRSFVTKENKEVTIRFWKNFHDEKEWRYVPNADGLREAGIERVIANPYVLNQDMEPGRRIIDEVNKSLKSERYKNLWLNYEFDDIRYIIVPDIQARINIIKAILKIPEKKFGDSKQMELEKQILISKILVLDEIRKDW